MLYCSTHHFLGHLDIWKHSDWLLCKQNISHFWMTQFCDYNIIFVFSLPFGFRCTNQIGHVKEFPKMCHFGIPRYNHTWWEIRLRNSGNASSNCNLYMAQQNGRMILMQVQYSVRYWDKQFSVGVTDAPSLTKVVDIRTILSSNITCLSFSCIAEEFAFLYLNSPSRIKRP